MNNIISNKEIGSPLTNEEIASFNLMLTQDVNTQLKQLIGDLVTVIKSQSDETKSMFTQIMISNTKQQELIAEGLKNMTDAQTAVKDAISENGNKSRRQFAAISHKFDKPTTSEKSVNPLFYSVHPEQRGDWIESARGKISDAVITRGINKGNCYNHIYSHMEKEGFNIKELLAEYRKDFDNPKAGEMEMISSSDALRQSFMRFADYYINKYGKSVRPFAKYCQKPSTGEYVAHPEEVNAIIGKLSRTGTPAGRTYQKAYKLLGINVDEYSEKARKKYKLNSHNSVAYLLSFDKKMIKKLDEVVNNYLAEAKKNG